MNVMRQTAFLVVNPITVDNFADLFNCMPAGRTSDLIMAPAYKNHSSWLGLEICLWSGSPGFNSWASVTPAFQCWSCCLLLILFHLSIES